MIIEKHFTNPYYIKTNGLSLGFLIHLFLTSKIEEPERKLIYLFYVVGLISHYELKYERNKLTKHYLLQKIFNLSNNKKYLTKAELRKLTGLSVKDTFNKYFSEHLIANNLESKRKFTLQELFVIFEFWQADDKWGRMKAFSKKELAKRFTNNNYDQLELMMTDNLLDIDYYKNHDYIKPGDAKKLNNVVKGILESKGVSDSDILYEEEFDIHYLYFFLSIVIIDKLQLLEA
jgi:hypothetical protein